MKTTPYSAKATSVVRPRISNSACRNSRKLFTQALALTTLCSSLLPHAEADVVIDWNAIMQTNISAGNPHFQSRAGAMTQLAVFEAVNAIVGDYEPYLGTIAASPGASPEAAVIAAAHAVLVGIVPGNVVALNAARDTSLATIADGPAKDAGIAVGQAAAAAILQLRANDGFAQVNSVPYTPGTNIGDWQPAPPSFARATFVGLGLVTPFALEEPKQFRPSPPPGVQTGKFANDSNEVNLVGKNDAGADARPQHGTNVARFFAQASPSQAWNPAARQVSLAQGRTLSENARIFALLTMAMADSSIGSYEAKYFYNYWRPQGAIMAGEIDGNPRTEGNTAWLPLLPTPTFPSYPSAHGTLSSAACTVLDRAFGNHGHQITLTNATLGVTLHYTSFRDILADVHDARVYGGIHFRFDQDAGERQGRDIAHYILDNYLRPLQAETESGDE